MEHLNCPLCSAPLDLFRGTVSRQRTYPLSLSTAHGVVPELVVDRVERTTDVLTCSRCEFAATVKDVLEGKVAA